MPRSHLPPKVFFERMNKKPALQDILDNIDNYTVEELEIIKGQPLWIRQQLVRIKKEKEIDYDTTPDYVAEQLADMMDGDPEQDKKNREQEYEIRKWIGSDWNMPAGRTGEYKIEIKCGDYFLVYQPERVKIQSSVSNMNEQQWNYFKQYTEYVGYMTVVEFAQFVSNQLTQKHPNATPINSHNDQNVDDRGLFRIIRN